MTTCKVCGIRLAYKLNNGNGMWIDWEGYTGAPRPVPHTHQVESPDAVQK